MTYSVPSLRSAHPHGSAKHVQAMQLWPVLTQGSFLPESYHRVMASDQRVT